MVCSLQFAICSSQSAICSQPTASASTRRPRNTQQPASLLQVWLPPARLRGVASRRRLATGELTRHLATSGRCQAANSISSLAARARFLMGAQREGSERRLQVATRNSARYVCKCPPCALYTRCLRVLCVLLAFALFSSLLVSAARAIWNFQIKRHVRNWRAKFDDAKRAKEQSMSSEPKSSFTFSSISSMSSN